MKGERCRMPDREKLRWMIKYGCRKVKDGEWW